jgi:hypothetical protein
MTSIRNDNEPLLVFFSPYDDDGEEPTYIMIERIRPNGRVQYITTIVSDYEPLVEIMLPDEDDQQDREENVLSFTPKGRPN